MTADIRGFIFDLDDVITETVEYHYRAWKRLADEEGLSFTREDNDQLRGITRRESLNILLKGRPISEAQAQEWMARKNDYYRVFMAQITPENLLPGVAAILVDAQARGIKLGIGSASRNAREVLRRLGLTDKFDAIGDGYTVSRSKPAPDLFVWVAGRLDLLPKNCVVFEDAKAGVEAALTAGMYCVGIGPVERIGRAHIVLPAGLAGFTVDSLLAQL